jgi:SAM-dependent methyltransferase
MSGAVDWVPSDVDIDVPSSARIYDYVLGGAHNFERDRMIGDQLAQVVPVREMARLNRSFLRRAVLFLVENGIRQFLDIGSGIPTVGNVHEIAQEADPACRVVYVDYEPVAVAHSRLILRDDPHAVMVQADLRNPERILSDPETRRMLDFEQPVGLLVVGVLQFVADADDPAGVIARFRDALPAGSYLALSHFTPDNMEEGMAKAVDVFSHSAEPIHPRSHAEVTAMFDGFELVEPGVVFTANWRPQSAADLGDDPEHSGIYAGVGRKP